ncbi:MAG TPA: hypothetical protein P5260_07320 [Candidatus Competibacter sp.]|nr:hypothetical protein [Candidatus Competibacter sp.]
MRDDIPLDTYRHAIRRDRRATIGRMQQPRPQPNNIGIELNR